MRAAETVVVGRPIGEVFTFLRDGITNTSWRPDVIEIHHVPGTGHGVGAEFAQTLRGPGGRAIRGDFRFVRCDEPTVLAFEVIAGPVRPTGVFRLGELSADSTEVRFTIDLQITGLMRMMRGVIERQVATEVAGIRRLPAALPPR